MGSVSGPGTRGARCTPYGPGDAHFTAGLVDVLADRDDALLAAYVDDPRTISHRRLRDALAAQTGWARVHPVFLGSAITGAGVDSLTAGVADLLPAAGGDVDGPASGTVFKVERGAAGERIAYVRMFSGTVRVRDRVPLESGDGARVTAISVFDRGAAVRRTSVAAGEIGKLWGLGEVRIGDTLGVPPATSTRHHFSPPILETVVAPRRPRDKGALYVALTQLAEQDPLIDLRQDDVRGEISVSLYGEVQKEVIQATLADEFGLEVTFRASTTICVERPSGAGAAVELIGKARNPFLATVGLRIEPAPAGSGVRYRLGVELGSMPPAFFTAVEETVYDTLRQGIHGWQVTDCTVTVTHSGFWAPLSTAGDFRNLTPLVLMDALRRAGTAVYEPVHRFRLEVPADTVGSVLPALARLRAVPHATVTRGTASHVDGEVPAARMHELGRQLPALTRGEGVLEFAFDRYEEVRGAIPSRPRSDHNPLNRKEYLLHVVRRVSAS